MTLLVDLATDLNYTKSENLSNNCSKNNDNISDGVGGKEFMTKKELGTEKKLETKKKLEMEYLKNFE